MTEAYSSIPNVQRYYGRVENGQIVEYGLFKIKFITFALLFFLNDECFCSVNGLHAFTTGSHIPFNFELILRTKIWTPTIANDFKTHIDAWLKTMPKGKGIHSNWVVRFDIHLKWII